MLVLSRFKGQEIVISRDGVEIARVMVVDVKGDKVRLGINAPRSVEIYEAKKQSQTERNPS